MNILYISFLEGKLFRGPTYSVPNQIKAQSKYDNVFWYNIVNYEIELFREYSFYHDLTEFPKESIKCLPIPFNKPDIVIIDGDVFICPTIRTNTILHRLSRINDNVVSFGNCTRV